MTPFATHFSASVCSIHAQGLRTAKGGVACEIDYRDVLLLPRQEEIEKGQAIGDAEA